MSGFGKVAGIGIGSVFALLGLMSSCGIVLAAPSIGTFTVEAPKAEISELFMYPELDEQGDFVLTQEIGQLSAWQGQTITWHGEVACVPVDVVIEMDYALMRDLVVKATSIYSPEGVYEDRPLPIEMKLDERGETIGLYISDIAISDLEVEVCCAYMGYLNYKGLNVYLVIE